MNKVAVAFHAPDHVEILKQRVLSAAADRLVNAAPHENARITVAQAESAKIGIDMGHLPGGVMVTFKDEREISTSRSTVAQRSKDRFKRTVLGSGIGMKKPQYGSLCLKGSSSNLATTAARAGHDAHAEASRDFDSTVFAASIGDEDFILAG